MSKAVNVESLLRLMIPGVVLVVTFVFALGSAAVPHATTGRFVSPDNTLLATVVPADKQKGFEEQESFVEIRSKDGARLRKHDFSSSDGEHGYGVDGAGWTPDSQFFVFRLRSSGGQSPMYAPVVFWSRRKNRFYHLDDYTADMTFSDAAPDKVKVDSWPDLKPATVSLHALQDREVSELR